MSWASELPQELTSRTLGLVVLTGLDVVYNAIHKAIWDSFCNNRRPDRMPIQLKLLGADHEYPKCRPKRTSYDWYVPKGILRTSWIHKHLEEIPSLVVIFFDLDWDEPLWKERQMECSTRLEIVRNSLQGRNCKVAVILVQKNAPLPPGEDMLATERADSLCTLCGLSAKSLFVLPITDHLGGYTMRLENAFYELSQAYYHAAQRRVKTHKDTLNKTTHQLLFVRHQFKIAFFSELKQDTQTALKHYKQAYTHITEMRMHNTNILEVKTIAGFITYKICRLSFQLSVPLDSIAQFRRHIDFFKRQIGTPELAFEHSAWMARQFQMFGDLFDEAIKQGLTAIQTQHPGFYYQQAANHTISRQQQCHVWCKPNVACPMPDLLDNVWTLEYYGQRPWRQGVQSIEPPDLIKEREGVLSLQVIESKVDHSSIIIPLLTNAVSQFKRYKSPRMKRYLMVQLAEEYQKAADYAKALALFSRVTWDYRQEKWWPLLTSILVQSLRCARQVANAQEYVRVCVELLNRHVLLPEGEKKRVQQNLLCVVQNTVPQVEPEQVFGGGMDPWSVNTNSEASGYKLEMLNLVSFADCKVSFSSATYTAEVPITVTVYFRITTAEPVRFSRLFVSFNNQAYNGRCIRQDGGQVGGEEDEVEKTASDLQFTPGAIRHFSFTFLALPEDVGRNIEINSVTLELGSDRRSVASLCWSFVGDESFVSASKNSSKFTVPMDKWNEIDEIRCAKVEPRAAHLVTTVDHKSPALFGEFYKVHVSLVSQEEHIVNNMRVSFVLDSTPEPSSYLYMDKADDSDQTQQRSALWDVASLEPAQQVQRVIFVKSLHSENFQLSIKVDYLVDVVSEGRQVRCRSHLETVVSVSIVSPYTLSFRLLSLQGERLEAVHAEEPFLLQVDVKCTSPWQLELTDSRPQLSPAVALVGSTNIKSHLANVILDNDCSARECLILVSQQSSEVLVPLGNYSIVWKRCSSDASNVSISTRHVLPSVAIEHVPLLVSLDLPSYGHVREALVVTYNVYNCTLYTQQAECLLEGSEAFMFSGPKQMKFRVLPSSTYCLRYQLVPLLAGNVTLPRLRLNLLRQAVAMDSVLQKMLPTHIFVLPSDRALEQHARVSS